MMLDAEGNPVALLNRHPLTQKRNPGPQKQRGSEATLEAAAIVLELIEQGKLQTRPPPLTAIPVNRQVRQLTADFEKELIGRAHTWGQTEARDQLVRSALGLAKASARKWHRSGFDFDELYAAAVDGLLRAAQTFEPGKDCRFSTYAMIWIRQSLQRFKHREERHTKPPITGAPTELNSKGDRVRPKAQAHSLNAPIYEDGTEMELGEQVPDAAESQERIIIRDQTNRLMREAIVAAAKEVVGTSDRWGPTKIRDHLQNLIEHRLLAEQPESQYQLAARCGITHQRVQQIEKRFLKVLRSKLEQHRPAM